MAGHRHPAGSVSLPDASLAGEQGNALQLPSGYSLAQHSSGAQHSASITKSKIIC